MSESTGAPRTTESTQRLEERSLLGSAYSFMDVGQMSTQTTSELADSNDD